jgi:hypothetical protein
MKYLLFSLVVLLAGCTETFKRKIKSMESEYLGGLERICTVYSNDGDILRTYKGKIDLKPSQTQLLFDLDGKRSIVRNGTVICDEI